MVNDKTKKGVNDAKKENYLQINRGIEVAGKNGGQTLKITHHYIKLLMTKSNSVPNENIERALKRLSGQIDSANYTEIIYEGYGPFGVAILVECMTDNRNRTSSDIKSTFNKYDGNTGEPGSVSYLFTRKAIFQFDNADDEIINLSIDNDCLDIDISDNLMSIEFEPNKFKEINELFQSYDYKIINSEIAYISSNSIMLDEKQFITY